MSANKYATLPDIDTAPDIYETEDVFPSSSADPNEYSDDDTGLAARASRGKANDHGIKEELDGSSLIGADEATKLFKRAERRRHRDRSIYQYPRSRSQSPTTSSPSLPLRLRQLQTELASLEAELADPANLQEHDDVQVDPAELIKGLVDVKGRLEKLTANREGRSKLVNGVLKSDTAPPPATLSDDPGQDKQPPSDKGSARDVADFDRRVGELEKLVGSSSASLDEASPMPPPLLPLLTRMNTQLTVLTQPRHLDNIARRLKLLLSDLDRLNPNGQQHRRQQSHHASDGPSTAAPSTIQDQLSPILTRLVPTLPHIPHILTRLRTLSSLHASAAEFQRALEGLEEDQRKSREALEELEKAVERVEGSLKDNSEVVKSNVSGLEERIDSLVKRMEQVNG